MRIFRAPESIDFSPGEPLVFLGGTIDNGGALLWQDYAADMLADLPIVVLNPRRIEWVPGASEELVRQQIDWEWGAMIMASTILLHFEPGSQSPITLQEHGYWCGAEPEKLVVSCPGSFWRAPNVIAVSRRFHARVTKSLNNALLIIRSRVIGEILVHHGVEWEFAEEYANGAAQFTDKPARDNCNRCQGANGGVRGNENIVAGLRLCDYCTSPLLGRTKRD